MRGGPPHRATGQGDARITIRNMRRCLRALIGITMLVAGAGGAAANSAPAPQAPATSASSTPSLKEQTRQWAETVKHTAKKVGAATQDAAHHVAEAAVRGAHAVAAESKAGYSKIKAKIQGERQSESRPASTPPH